MMLKIPEVLDRAGLDAVRTILAEGPWVDGNETSGSQSRQAKRNRQLRQGCEAAHKAGRLVLDALGTTPDFIAAALPLKVFPPMFNRYTGGDAFGAHVDNSIRTLPGTDFRIRADLSATLFLDEPETYDGGELVVHDLFGAHQVKLPAGHMVLYPASSLHRVTPVTQGTRTACVFWLQSMVREDAAREQLYRLDRTIRSLSGAPGSGGPGSDGPGSDGRDETGAAVLELTNLYHNLMRRWADA